jgi:TetR/AcrR family transcriptional repressor of nem operon
MGRPKTYDRAEVLRKATDLFWRKGYEGTHLGELVEATGINRFSLYKEFGGKQGLFQAALEGYLASLAGLSAILEREPLGLANIRAFYEAFLEREFLHGCFALNTIREKHVVPGESYAQIESFARSSEEVFRRNLAAARAQGELDPGLDLDGLAKFLTASDMGLLTYGIVSPDKQGKQRIIAVLERMLR